MPDATVLSLLKAAAPLTVGTELAALLSGKLNGAAAFKAAAERLGRLAAVLAAVTAATQRAPSSSSSSYFLLSSSAPFRAAAAAALAQWHTACFHWTGAAYVALRAAGSRATSAASKGKVPAHLTLWAIFTCCEYILIWVCVYAYEYVRACRMSVRVGVHVGRVRVRG